MEIKDFAVEQWMNEWETMCTYNVAETCVFSVSLDELFEICETDATAFMAEQAKRPLTYGDIEGNPAFLEGVASLYKTIEPHHIIPTHGAAGANMLALSTLTGPGKRVVSIMPTYQQLYSIPEMCGADVRILHLEKDDAYHVNINRLREVCSDGADVICINNPDNPTGALLSEEELRGIIEVAKEHDAWLVCDEVYRLLTQDGAYQPSVADLYDKGVVTSSMSKVWSLACLRLGWCITRDPQLRRQLLSHRDYDLISCGILNEAIAALALSHKDRLLERSHRIVTQNLQSVMEWVDAEPRLSIVRPQGGTTALVYYNFPIDSYDFCTRMVQEEGALVTPGDCFEEPRSFRLGYAYSDNVNDLEEGLAAISRILRKLEASA